MQKTIIGSFDSYGEAQSVVDDLKHSGFRADDVSVVANNLRDDVELPSDDRSGAATGALTGGAIGGAAGLTASLIGLTIPVVGPVIALGPIAAALAGAGVGVVAGGLIGGLTDLGVNEDDAHYYAEAVRRGAALVIVKADAARADEAAAIMKKHDAVDIEKRVEMWRDEGWKRFDPAARPYTLEQLEQERLRYARGAPSRSSTRTSFPIDETRS